MRKKILQMIANRVIRRLENSINNQSKFDIWLYRGQRLDEFCIDNFDLYLD